MFAASKTSTASSGYQISRSLRFNNADSTSLTRTPATATNQKTWTWSGWLKRSALKAQLPAPATFFNVNGNGFNARFSEAYPDSLEFYNYSGAAFQLQIVTTPLYRDVSAWYHIVFVLDTTQATNTNRFKIYVNGLQVTALGGVSPIYPNQNTDLLVNNTSVHALGTLNGIGLYYDGYMTEVNFIDGQALTPSSFGETNAQTGVWQPKAYSGSYGTNGFYLNFSDNSNTTAATLGKDYSGNGNNWTPNNFSVTAGAGNDSLVDSPTSFGTDTGVGGEVRGNYCTLNPLDFGTGTLSNGNLDWSATSGTGLGCFSTFAFDIADSTNKYYWEFTLNSGDLVFGIVATTTLPSNTSRPNSYSYYTSGSKYNGTTFSSYGASFTTGAIIGVSVGGGTITFYKNGVSQGAAFTGLTGIFKPAIWEVVCTATANFGQRPFAYTAPSGYKALNTQNLPTPTIGATTATQAGTYFNTITWTGTGSGTTRSLTGVGFQPDWVWTKSRSAGYDHQIYDAVRGAGSTKSISSNSANSEAQGNVALYGYVSAFNSDGFTGTNGTDGSIPSAYYNQSGQTYVAWNWKESVTAGFDIVTYTGTGANRTVAHNLGVAPKMIFIKASNLNSFWQVYNADNGATKTIYLNASNAATTDSTSWNNTAPTSSVFTVGTNADVNSNTYSYIAYCFAEVAGYSKFGSYTGNGSADGPFVFTGFRPAYVMVKVTTASNVWLILDAVRNTSNVVTLNLNADQSAAENTFSGWCDFTSNGFKIRNGSDGAINTSSGNYIFMAFATSPFKYSLAR